MAHTSAQLDCNGHHHLPDQAAESSLVWNFHMSGTIVRDQWLMMVVAACSQAARLQAVLAGDVEAYLSDRHVLDILEDFPAAHVEPLQVAPSALPAA